jgi:hypothetical protein
MPVPSRASISVHISRGCMLDKIPHPIAEMEARIKELEGYLIGERKKYLLLIHPNASTLYAASKARKELIAEGKLEATT